MKLTELLLPEDRIPLTSFNHVAGRNWFARLSARASIMFSDWCYHMCLGILILAPVTLLTILLAFGIETIISLPQPPLEYGKKAFEIATIIIVAIMLNKDFFGGRSVIKRIWGFKVVDYQTGADATEFQCMVRNISIILCPLEALVILISRERRLGDILAGTRVIDAEPIPSTSILSEIRNKKFDRRAWLTVSISLVIGILNFLYYILL
jgi:uncharacterized RDD family membrane protein YckC